MGKNQILDKISYKNLYKPFGYINGEWIDSTPDGLLTPGEERLFDSYPLFYDVETVMGRSFLANHLSILAVHTSSQNGKNKLSCNTDRCN